jgi:tetratricopeptide (TPR) repeat protein
MMRKLLLFLALAGAVMPAKSQDKPAVKTDAKPASKLEIVNAGELRLDGKITALLGTGVWQIEASSWTSPRGVMTDFPEPKNKGVQVAENASIHPRGEETKVPLQDVKLGSRIAVIGKNGPDGTLIAREVVLLEGYGARKTVGQIATNPFTSALIRQSREARDAGQLPKALALAEKAIATAQGLGDQGGEGLATQDKALLHADLDQNDEAFKAFKRVESLGRAAGNPLLMSLGMRGGGGILLRGGRLQEAITLLKEADPISANTEPQIHLGVLTTLFSAHLIAGQLAEGVTVLSRVAPLEQSLGKDSDAGETLLLIAALNAGEKPDAAREALAEAKTRLERARNDADKARLIGASALVRHRLGETEAALAGFTETATLLEGTGDAAGAKRWREMAQTLQGAGEGWQEWWLAASGLKKAMAEKKEDEIPKE